jgi:uncharacterized protein (DUF1499 family)
MAYDHSFAPIQKGAYPTIGTRTARCRRIRLSNAYAIALEHLPNMRVTYSIVKEGRIEAISVSRIFRFVDDVVVRIRPVAEGSVIDVRSRSRVGKAISASTRQRIENLLSTLH